MADKRRVQQEQRIKHQLEIQSRQIEQVMERHEMTAQVAGGTVRSRQVSFDLQTPVKAGLDRLRTLTDELITALRATDVRVSKEDGVWRLHVTRAEEPPVGLLDLMSVIEEVPPVTAVLGLAEDGSPILLDFSTPEITHVLISGTTAAGKTSLLKTIAVSLACQNRQSQLQLLILGNDLVELKPLSYLPHVLAPVIHQPEAATEALHSLAKEMAYRLEQQVATPTIIVCMDDADVLLEAGGKELGESVTRLAQRGDKAGIHLILSTRQPGDTAFSSLLKANLPLRLVGQTEDAPEAQIATGIQGTQAEYLLGQGDFLAVVGEETTHFQVAFLSDYDVHLLVEKLQRQKQPALLAQPFALPTALAGDGVDDRSFSFNGELVAWEDFEE